MKNFNIGISLIGINNTLKKSDILLDLFNNKEEEEVQVAHDEKKEEKEEISQGPIEVKTTKKKVSVDDEDDEVIKKILKYGLIGGSLVFLIYFISKYRKRVKDPDMHDMMMFMMCQTLMQNMQQQQQNKGSSLPPQIVTDDNTKFSTDWSDWYEKNKNKEFAKFGSTGTGSDAKVMNKMHVAENWKVRRNLNGKILDVNKTNSYIR